MESILYDSKKGMAYRFGLDILDYVPRDMEQSIIDIGSGSGALTKELMRYAGTVIGVDKNVHTIMKSMAKYPDVTFYVMDALRLQYENRFDVAFSNATFHEIYDKLTLLRSIKKSLKPGGKLIAEFASRNCESQYFDILQREFLKYNLDPRVASFFHLIDKEECERLLLEAGFEVEFISEHKKKAFFKNDMDAIRERIRTTISRDVDADIVEKIISDLTPSRDMLVGRKGWLKDVFRVQIIAKKPL